MTQLFIQLAMSVTGAVILVVALLVVAAIIGYLTAWFYAKSVYTPKIKLLEADKVVLNKQVDELKADKVSLNTQVDSLRGQISLLNDKTEKLNKTIAKFEVELKEKNTGKFMINKAKDGQNYFNLKSPEGHTILKSEMYTTRTACNNGIESVRRNCDDDSKYERKVSSDNRYYFNLKATNGQIIGTSDMHGSKESMEEAIEIVKIQGKTMYIEDILA